MVTTSASSLTLEQTPLYRGSIMSLKAAAVNLGSAFGGALGGIVTLSIGYEGSIGILGFMGILSGAVFYLYAIDPTKK
jgi:predicted MFS family arabinose efflux permease